MSFVSYTAARAAAVTMYNKLVATYQEQANEFESTGVEEPCVNLAGYIAVRVMLGNFADDIKELNAEGMALVREIVEEIREGTLDEEAPPKAQA